MVPLQLVLLIWLAAAFGLSLASSTVVPFVLARTLSYAPDARHRALLLLAVSPMVFATVFVLAVLTPSALAVVWPRFDHCLTHPGHIHLCLAHLPAHSAAPGVLAGLLVVVTYCAGRGLLGLQELWRASRWSRRLVASATGRTLGAYVLPTPSPLCMLVGLVRPSILVSRGLLGSVTKAELEAIVRHERAHADRHDTLTRLVARVATLFLLPGARGTLLQAIEISAEQSADEVAAAALGDRLAMAETILKVERLLELPAAELRAVAVPFGGTSVPQRVASLLDDRSDRRPRSPSVLAAASMVAIFVASTELHHATETLLGLIAH